MRIYLLVCVLAWAARSDRSLAGLSSSLCASSGSSPARSRWAASLQKRARVRFSSRDADCDDIPVKQWPEYHRRTKTAKCYKYCNFPHPKIKTLATSVYLSLFISFQKNYFLVAYNIYIKVVFYLVVFYYLFIYLELFISHTAQYAFLAVA